MKRNYSIDLIKTMAAFFVVAVHFLLNSGFYDQTIQTNLTLFWMMTRQVTITAVPLFLLCTGFLMNRKKLSVSYLLNLFPVLFLYVSISLVGWLRMVVMDEGVSLTDALFGILDYSTNTYSWYVEMYIGLYLMIPLLNLIWQANQNQFFHRYVVGVSLFLFFGPSLLNSFGKVVPDFWIDAYPIGYYFIGAYLFEYQEQFKKFKKTWLLLLIATFAFFVLDVILDYQTTYQDFAGNQYNGFEPLIVSFLIFVCCLRIPVTKGFQLPIRKLSQWTLGIYLMSDVTDQLVYPIARMLLPTMEQRLTYGFVIILTSFSAAVLFSYPFERSSEWLRRKLRGGQSAERKDQHVSSKIH